MSEERQRFSSPPDSASAAWEKWVNDNQEQIPAPLPARKSGFYAGYEAASAAKDARIERLEEIRRVAQLMIDYCEEEFKNGALALPFRMHTRYQLIKRAVEDAALAGAGAQDQAGGEKLALLAPPPQADKRG